MVYTILFIVTLMSALTHIVGLLSIGVFGNQIKFPHIYGWSLGSAVFSYPSIGYQIYFWFNYIDIL